MSTQLLNTAIAGSLTRSACLSETNKPWPQWKAEGGEVKQAKADATLLWITVQEDAGFDVIGDGEQSHQYFVHGFLQRVEGIDFDHTVKMGIPNNRNARWFRRWCQSSGSRAAYMQTWRSCCGRMRAKKNQVHATVRAGSCQK